MKLRSTVLEILFTVVAAVALAQPSPSPDFPTTVVGTVTAVSGQSIAIGGVTVDISGAKLFAPGGVSSAGSLKVGSHVTAVLRPGTTSAVSVNVDADLRIGGLVEAVQPGTIIIAGQTIAVVNATSFGGFASNQPVKKLSDLTAGQPVLADVSLVSGQITAMQIWGSSPAPKPPTAKPIAAKTVVDGVIASIQNGVYLVGSTRVLTSPQTKISGAPAVGDQVHVVGMHTADGSVIAVTIDKE